MRFPTEVAQLMHFIGLILHRTLQLLCIAQYTVQRNLCAKGISKSFPLASVGLPSFVADHLWSATRTAFCYTSVQRIDQATVHVCGWNTSKVGAAHQNVPSNRRPHHSCSSAPEAMPAHKFDHSTGETRFLNSGDAALSNYTQG